MSRILFCSLKPALTTNQFVNRIVSQCKYTTFGVYKPALTFKPIQFGIQLCRNQPKRAYQSHQALLDIDVSKLTKDVIIYKYANDRYFKLFNLFGLVQFFIMTLCAESVKNKLVDIPVDETAENYSSLKFYEKINLGNNKYRYALSVGCCALGILILSFTWMYTLKTVKFVILRKGGKMVSLVTYRPMGNNGILTVPLNCLNALEHRQNAHRILPLKVKNKLIWYMLDMRGEFTNAQLFDYVVNLRRAF